MKQVGWSILFYLGLIGSVTQRVWGQDPLFLRYTKTDGLPSNTVYDIRQDPQGFLWIATENGLARYDGTTFRTYVASANKSNAFSNILWVDGDPWVQNFHGQFFRKNGQKLAFQPQVSKSSNFVLGHDFGGSKLGAISQQTLLLFDPKTKHTTTIQLPPAVWLSSVNSTRNHYYLTDRKFILRIDTAGNIQRERLAISLTNPLYHWLVASNEHYFISKTDGYLFAKNSGQRYDFRSLIGTSFVQNAHLLNARTIAILTPNGLILFDTKSKRFSQHFKGYSCSKLVEDREGNWWLGTHGKGLIFIPRPTTKTFLTETEITALSRIGEHLYLGTHDHRILRYTPRQQGFTTLFASDEKHPIKSLYYNEETNDFLVCSSFFWYQWRGHQWQKKAISVNDIVQLDRKHYLLSESNNLSIFPLPANSPWKTWLTQGRFAGEGRLLFFGGNRRFLDACFHEGVILARASDGLWEIEKNTQRKLTFGSPYTDVVHLEKDRSGLLITTSDQGLFLYRHKRLQALQAINKTLKNKRIQSAKRLGNYIYVRTDEGIIKVDFTGKIIARYCSGTGYLLGDINDFAVYRTNMYVASNKGLIIVPLHERRTDGLKPPRLILTENWINEQQAERLDGKILLPEQTNIAIDFSVIQFKSLKNYTVYYQINGKRKVPLTTSRLTLNELAPGNYIVRLFAQTEDGQLRSNTITQRFKILAPFYARFWFVGTVLLFIGFVGWSAFRYRVRQIHQKNKILQEKLELEKRLHESTLTSIKAQMNPHFIFNALNTIQSFIYTNEKHAASSYLVDFSDLTRKILDMSNKAYVSLSEELEAIQLYLKLEKMRFEDDFDFEIDTTALPHLSFQIPSMLIQPYLENAIKHGLLHKNGAKHVSVRFQVDERSLTIEIKDNGIGLRAAERINTRRHPNHQGFATTANQKRLEILNQLSSTRIGVEIQELLAPDLAVQGTLVRLQIPIHPVEGAS